MSITEITKKEIIDSLKLSEISWYGKLDEDDFLKRIYNLKELPSFDPRHEDMEGDVYRHRVMNDDWDDDWVFNDSRLNIMGGEDETFLKFVCEMLHPVVRSDKKELDKILDILNTNLQLDGYKIIVEKHISGRPVFGYIKGGDFDVKVENKDKIGRKFILEQIEKCERKINEKDYDGAITNARSLVEDVIARDIYKQITGEEMKTKGDLVDDYNKVKVMLNLTTRKDIDESFRAITTGLTAVINGIAAIRNKMSDGHSREIKPLKHHAKVVVNSAKVLVDFLYDVLEYQKQRKSKLYKELLALPYIRYGEGTCYYGKCYNFLSRDEMLEKIEYKTFLEKCDTYLKFLLKEELVNNFDIQSYDYKDKFLISLVVLLDVLIEKDIIRIYDKHKSNSQISVKMFIDDIYKAKPELVKRNDLLLLVESKN